METKIFGELESEDTFNQMQVCTKLAKYSALMADNHLGYSMPIGGVIAYKDLVSPSGVGYDIACGNKAVLLDTDPNYVKKNISKIMDEIYSNISFGVGRANKEDVDHDLFYSDTWNIAKKCFTKGKMSKDKARHQLGTVGSGNHYVDIFEDEKGAIWCGVHFGSRGLGHKIATYFVNKGGGKDAIFAEPVLLDVNSELGQEYLACMELAGEYAYAGRDWVCQKVADILGSSILFEVHNHHNFTWKETHFGEDLYVVRKGATPAFPNQLGFVGGSMGDISVILKGLDSEQSREALYSTIHGAGRVMGRREAAGRFKWKRVEEGKRKVRVQTKKGKISKEMMMSWVNDKGVELRGGGMDESPHCYKRIESVIEAHKETISVLTVLKPLGVAMAGSDEFDPYKD